MEEDIKILEEIIESYKESYVEEHEEMNVDVTMNFREFKALQNLIARYKELEEELIKDKNKIDFLVGNKLAEVHNHAKEVEINMNAIYIPKSKVKEKIEKLKILAEKSNSEEELYIRKNQIYLLENLLQDFLETGNHIPRID